MEGEQKPHLQFESLGGTHEELPEQMRVVPWSDPLTEELGFAPRHMYVETVYLPVLGPTASWLYRRLGSWAAHNPDGIDVNLNHLSMTLGLGEGLGRNSKIAKGLGRLVRFQIARAGAGELQVRTALPPLPFRTIQKLDSVTQALHNRYIERPHRDRNGLVT
jgi:hypothetical protein